MRLSFLSNALIALLSSLLLSPILEARINALSLVVSLTLIGGLLGLTRLKALPGILAALFAIPYATFALSPLAQNLAPFFIEKDPLPAKADAIVVLSAESPYRNRLKSQGLERLLHAKLLLEQGHAESMVLTDQPNFRGNPKEDRDQILGELSKRSLSVGPVHNTFDEAQAVNSLLRAKGWNKIILVTSPIHSRRAKAIFLQQMPGVTAISSPAQAREFDIDLLVTSLDRLKVARLITYEVAAWAKNSILGRV